MKDYNTIYLRPAKLDDSIKNVIIFAGFKINKNFLSKLNSCEYYYLNNEYYIGFKLNLIDNIGSIMGNTYDRTFFKTYLNDMLNDIDPNKLINRLMIFEEFGEETRCLLACEISKEQLINSKIEYYKNINNDAEKQLKYWYKELKNKNNNLIIN